VFKGDGFQMEINGKHPMTGAWGSIVAASGKQRISKAVSQFERLCQNQGEIIFAHGSLLANMCEVPLMRTAVDGASNVLGMILWTLRGRVDCSGTTRAVSLRTI